MKKLYSLALCLIMGLSAFAQVDETFVFTDAAGNVIPNGSTITVKNYEEDPFEGTTMFPSGLYVKNNSNANAYAGMTVNITKMDNGKVQHCFPGTCQMYESAQKVVREDAKGIKVGENQSIQSEWIPASKGTCTVIYTIRVMEQTKPMPPTYDEKAECASVTVNYVYDDSSVLSISDINADKTVKSNTLVNIAGQKVNNNYKGVVVKNGKKVLVK
ncbi:MAG: hypothetical protein HUK06_06485 [Bacteroidaceae bacterium]|nr:hypothetical protein [Bacteroidaceae bacterium]